MALNGWHWTIFGIIISISSGYIYFAVPKNGSPNYAMALFFFIGIIFILIGLVKLFFKRADDRAIFDSANRSEKTNQFQDLRQNQFNNQSQFNNQPNQNAQMQKRDLSVQMELVTPKEPVSQNRVEQAVAEMAKAEQKHSTHHKTSETRTLHTGHTNSYARTHHYHGPTKTIQSTSPNSNHPVNSHIQHRVQNTTEHSIKCRKCGGSNTSSANYCHTCGNRLK
ncbi:MAG TPA: zinc ribbon domain-containing protein [Allocoleopsis sp.]